MEDFSRAASINDNENKNSMTEAPPPALALIGNTPLVQLTGFDTGCTGPARWS
jgi:hypothetical protein